jgi:hypothetical protein
MANNETPIFNLIPSSLHEDLLKEAEQILKDLSQQNKQQQGADPAIAAYAQRKKSMNNLKSK